VRRTAAPLDIPSALRPLRGFSAENRRALGHQSIIRAGTRESDKIRGEKPSRCEFRAIRSNRAEVSRLSGPLWETGRGCRRYVQLQPTSTKTTRVRHFRLLATQPCQCQCLSISPPRGGIPSFARITLSPLRPIETRDSEGSEEGRTLVDTSLRHRNSRTVKTIKTPRAHSRVHYRLSSACIERLTLDIVIIPVINRSSPPARSGSHLMNTRIAGGPVTSLPLYTESSPSLSALTSVCACRSVWEKRAACLRACSRKRGHRERASLPEDREIRARANN